MKFTIVTPTLNRRAYLASTGDSIRRQTGDFDLEWLVIDGGSTDGSVEWLGEQAATDPRIRYTSGPDAGQSDAINKGLAMASGDVVAWLNADDLYAEGALAAVADALVQHAQAQWLVGRYEVIDEHDRLIRELIVRYKQRKLSRYRYATLLRENVIPQPAVFWRRSFGHQVGLLDTSLHWTMDYDLWLRMAKVSPPLVLDRLVARFRHHQTSKSGDFNRRQFDEGRDVAQRHAQGDRLSLMLHRLNVEKIVCGYRMLRLLGR